MLETKEPHLDDFTLLRYVAFDLDEIERKKVAGHVETCPICQPTLREIEELNRELAAVARDSTTQLDWKIEDLPEGDPFRRRVLAAPKLSHSCGDRAVFAAGAVGASEEGATLSIAILTAVKNSLSALESELASLNFSDATHRFGLLYALQESGRQIAENPARFFASAMLVLDCLRKQAADSTLEMERFVPMKSLLGQAHHLAAQACLWTREFDKAESHLRLAYRFFGEDGDEFSIAATELLESQRRALAGYSAEALVLARRSRTTFESLGQDDYVARSEVAEGLSLSGLGRLEDAIGAYRRALPVFEQQGLWSNYVGAVNSTGTALAKLGRLSEAKREYARAFRHVSHEHHRAYLAPLRHSLAEVLFLSGRYREAAVSLARARRLYAELRLLGYALKAALLEIECWARAGDLARARQRLETFKAEVFELGALDPSIARGIDEALSGGDPDLKRFSDLRTEAGEALDERLSDRPA
jgi:tetratricopeptide (TPR) repeat protein